MAVSYVDLGRRLKDWRLASSLKAEDVADRLGLSRAAVYRLERREIVKVEGLEKVSAPLTVSLALLRGVEVEYSPRASGFFERMRELEENTAQLLAHFEPVSFLLTSPDYPDYLRAMLLEAIPADLRATQEAEVTKDIDDVLQILGHRKAQFARRRASIISLVGTREIERFLHLGLVR